MKFWAKHTPTISVFAWHYLCRVVLRGTEPTEYADFVSLAVECARRLGTDSELLDALLTLQPDQQLPEYCTHASTAADCGWTLQCSSKQQTVTESFFIFVRDCVLQYGVGASAFLAPDVLCMSPAVSAAGTSNQPCAHAADTVQNADTASAVLQLQALLFTTKLTSLVHHVTPDPAKSQLGPLPAVILILQGQLLHSLAKANSKQLAVSAQHKDLLERLTQLQVQVTTYLLQAMTNCPRTQELSVLAGTLIAVLNTLLQSASTASTAAEEFCKHGLAS